MLSTASTSLWKEGYERMLETSLINQTLENRLEKGRQRGVPISPNALLEFVLSTADSIV